MFLSALVVLFGIGQSGEAPEAIEVQPVAETMPVPSVEDAADDPAIWVRPDAPEQSLIIATDKECCLLIYDLKGEEKFRIPAGEPNNVDLRDDIVVTGDGKSNSLLVYRLDPSAPSLRPLRWEGPQPKIAIYGLCLGQVHGALYVFITSKAGELEQWALQVNGDAVRGKRVRAISLRGQAEGCVCDDEAKRFYVAEEEGRLLGFPASPDSHEATPTIIDAATPAGRLTPDIEGLAVYAAKDGAGYLLASSQGSNAIAVYDRTPPHAFRALIHVGEAQGIDEVTHTDGIEVTGAPLGAALPAGLLVAQDDENDSGQHQNFKLVDWRGVEEAIGSDRE